MDSCLSLKRLREMKGETTPFMIWTRVVESISFEDNYTSGLTPDLA